MKLQSTEDYLVNLRPLLVENYKNLSHGIRGLIEYRISECKTHVDSVAKKYFFEVYGSEDATVDTIFNCWSIFRIFAVNRLKDIGFWDGLDYKKDCWLEKACLKYMENIFQGYTDFKILFDELAELHHSFANFMPAPKGLNGHRFADGKGNYKRDNDFPDIYYQRAKTDFPKQYQWIQENKDRYALHFFTKFHSGLGDKKANANYIIGKENYERVKIIVKSEIECIKERAVEIEKIYSANTLGNGANSVETKR